MSTEQPLPAGGGPLPAAALRLMIEQAARRRSETEPAAIRLQQLLAGHWLTQAIYVAVKLQLPDLLAGGPRAAGDLAAACGAHAPSLTPVLRLLAGLDILAVEEDGRFALTPISELLRAGATGSWRAEALLMGEVNYPAFGELLYAVTTGGSAFGRAHGTGFYDYLARHPEPAGWFTECMSRSVGPWIPAFVESTDFSGCHTVVDVGGGDGTLIGAILRANPAPRGIVFDLPHAVRDAGQVFTAAGVTDRATAIAGDIICQTPPAGDTVVLARMLLNWDDARVVAILSRCRAAMPAGGRLLVVDVVVPDGRPALSALVNDLNLMVIFAPGRQRTEAEFRALFVAAGLNLIGVRTLDAHGDLPLRVLEGRPAPSGGAAR